MCLVHMPLFQSGVLEYSHVNHPNEVQGAKIFQPNMVENLEPHKAVNKHNIQFTNDLHSDNVLCKDHLSLKDVQSMLKWLQKTL